MKKNQIIFIIIGVLILIGFVSSFSYWLGQKSIEVKSETITPDFLTSKVIRKWSAVAFGVIIDISDHTLTLNKGEDVLIIPISETAKIYLSGLAKEGEKPEQIQFEEIQIGDEVSITVEIREGEIWGDTVTILPPK